MRQQICTFDSLRRGTRPIGYLLHLPTGYADDPSARWPLVLFLHGSGERGSDPTLLTRTALPRLLEERDDLPCVVVSPQCAARSTWRTYLRRLPGFLDHALARYAVDPARVYFTGISMGGYATWHLGATLPDRVAALAPICGYGLESQGFPQLVSALKDVPVWAFHGERDPIVPAAASQVLVDALRAYGGHARLTIYPDVGHDAWTRTYADPALWTWLLAQYNSHDR